MKGKLKKTGFTMVELLVAIGVLVIILATTSVIFKVCIESQRKASAMSEIMRNLRGITDQLDEDFKGLQKDAPIAIWFEYDGSNRYDQMMFFASGDFQSLNAPISGNLARIYYGNAGPDPAYMNLRLLARRQHVLTADISMSGYPNSNFSAMAVAGAENATEYDFMSLSEWKTIPVAVYQNIIMPACLDTSTGRPIINTATPVGGLHMLMCQGVSNFSIQFAQWDNVNSVWIWLPKEGFDIFAGNHFGLYCNVPGGAGFPYWAYRPTFGYKALKFTFTLYDSNGVLKGGRTFTHIIYID